MDPANQSQLPPALISGIKEALACGLIGVVVSAGVYGITILQAYIYFRNNPHDSENLRSFVALLFFLDTVSMALTVSIYYEYFVTAFGNQSLLFHTPTTFAFENGVTVLIGTLTQCFFAQRLWALSKRNIMVVGSIVSYQAFVVGTLLDHGLGCWVILALCSFGPGVAISVNLHAHSDIYYLGSLETRILAGFANGLSVVCDIVIAASLTYYLHYKRTVCARRDMITIVGFPGHFVFFVFGLLDGKLYCNTLLATLNAQKSMIRERDNVVELGTQVFNRSPPRNANHQGAAQQSDRASDCMPTFVVDITDEKTMSGNVTRSLSVDHNDT